MGRPADVLSGTEYRIATWGTGGAAVERPELADEDADCIKICVARQGRIGRRVLLSDLSHKAADSQAILLFCSLP